LLAALACWVGLILGKISTAIVGLVLVLSVWTRDLITSVDTWKSQVTALAVNPRVVRGRNYEAIFPWTREAELSTYRG
jgi:hypothetical protein